MAKAELPKGIMSISGTLGGLLYKTYHKANGETETRVYRNPYYRRAGEKQSWRKTPVTAKERAARERFALMAKEVTAKINAGDRRTKKEIWKEVKEHYASCES